MGIFIMMTFELFRQEHEETRTRSIANQVAQIGSFVRQTQVDDWVVCPLETRSVIAVARLQSDYKFRKDLGDTVHHTYRKMAQGGFAVHCI
jgi:predicted Mrr-cat superfamily restriction endonuclease